MVVANRPYVGQKVCIESMVLGEEQPDAGQFRDWPSRKILVILKALNWRKLSCVAMSAGS